MSGFKFTIGSDPEFFVKDRNGNVVSAIGLFGGTKEEPKPLLKEMGDGFCVQEDNVAVEFNIPPSSNRESFIKNISTIISKSGIIMPEGHTLFVASSHEFSEDQLKHPSAAVFGCSPDYNAWDFGENPAPSSKTNLRVCGGHVSVGTTVDNPFFFARAMDLALGVPSCFIDRDLKRRSLYGQAGAFRPTDFGIEYRSLSNFWTKDEELTGYVYDGVEKALQIISDFEEGYIPEEYAERVQAAMNHDDLDEAELLCREFKIDYHKPFVNV